MLTWKDDKPYEPGIVPAVALFPRDTLISVMYRTTPEAVATLLPPGFTAPEPIVQFRYRRADGVDWIDGGTISAIGVSVFARYEEADEPVEGAFWPTLFEDDYVGAMFGPLLMGVAKRMGVIEASLDVNGWSYCSLSDHGRPLIGFEFEHGDELVGDHLNALRESASRATNVLGLRQIPSVDQRAVELSQVTCYPIRLQIARAWSGRGSVQLYDTDPRVNGNSDRVLAMLRALPLLENLGAVFIQSSFEIHIGEGRVLATLAGGSERQAAELVADA